MTTVHPSNPEKCVVTKPSALRYKNRKDRFYEHIAQNKQRGRCVDIPYKTLRFSYDMVR